MPEQLANLAQTTLAKAIGVVTAGTSEVILVASTVKFPTEGNFRVNLGGGELGLVTAVEGVHWTTTRGAEGTTPIAHPVGQIVTHVLTTGALAAAFDAHGAAATAQAAAETAAMADVAAEATARASADGALASSITVERSRAEGVEVTKAATSALTAETSARETAVTGERTRAETAEAANATAVTTEKGRAEAAEGAKLAKASNLSDLASVSTARTNLGLGTAATEPKAAFDIAGAASTEQARAEAVEALKLAKASNLSDLASATAARVNLGLGSAATHASTDFDAAGAAAAETAARETAVSGEASARVTAVGAEATTRAAADATEKARAEAAEALAVPLTQKGTNSGVGTLDTEGHQPTSQLSPSVVRSSSVWTTINMGYYGAEPGVDCSAKIVTALEDARSAHGIKLKFPAGLGYKFSMSAGAHEALGGRPLTIEGEGKYATTFTPASAVTPLLSATAWGDVTGNELLLRDCGITLTADRAYSNPVVSLTLIRGIRFDNVRVDCGNYTATVFHFDSCWQFTHRGVEVVNGKYAVPFEIVTVTNLQAFEAPPQIDTMTFEDIAISGCCGLVARSATNDGHTLRLPNFKVYNTNYYSGNNPATEAQVVTTQSGTTAAGATTIQVESIGSGEGARSLRVGDAIAIDMSASFELAKIKAISGSGPYTIELSQPLVYAHPGQGASCPVVQGGIGIVIGNNVNVADLSMIHVEGFVHGVDLGNTIGTRVGGYNGCSYFIRGTGNVTGLTVSSTEMIGSAVKNQLYCRPTYSYGTGGGYWLFDGPFVKGGASYTLEPLLIPGNEAGTQVSTRYWRSRANPGTPTEIWNVPTAEQGRNAIRRGGRIAGVPTSFEYWTGMAQFPDGVSGKYVSGAGKTTAADGDFTSTPIDGMTEVTYDTTTRKARLHTRANGKWQTSGSSGLLLPTSWPSYKEPGAATQENKPVLAEPAIFLGRRASSELALVSGTPMVCAHEVPAGLLISGIVWFVNAAEGTPANRTHLWAALLNSAGKVLAKTADFTSSTNTSMSGGSARGLQLSATYETTETMLLYAMVSETMSSTAPIKIGGTTVTTGMSAMTPVLYATGPSGQTTPPEVEATLALTAAANAPYLALV